MGEMADFINSSDDFPDDDGLYNAYTTKTCRRCGKSGLHWGITLQGKWRLAEEDNSLHICAVAVSVVVK